MATLALGVIAASSSLTGTQMILAKVAAGFVGSIIDNFLIMPLLMPNRATSGSRLDEIRIQTSTEGVPIPWCHGPHVRASGNIIWYSDLIERRVSEKVGSGKQKTTVHGWEYFCHVAMAFAEAPHAAGIMEVKRILANGKVLYDADDADAGEYRYDKLNFYNGSIEQEPSSLQEEHLGVGNVPAYHGIAYFEIENLALKDFGNSLPQFSVEFAADTSLTVYEMLERVCKRAELPSYRIEPEIFYDIEEKVEGFVINGPTSMLEVLTQLMFAYNIGAYEDENTIVFFRLQEPSYFFIDETEAVIPFDFTERDSTQLPSKVVVDYFDPTTEMQKGSVQAVNQSSRNASTTTVALGLTLDPSYALKLANQHLWRFWTERLTLKTVLPPSYRWIKPGVHVLFSDAEKQYATYLSEVTVGFNQQVEVEAVVYATALDSYLQFPQYLYHSAYAEAANINPPSSAYQIPGLIHAFLDLPPFTAECAYLPSLLFAATTEEYNQRIINIGGFKEDELVFTTDYKSTIGYLATSMPVDVGSSTHIGRNGSVIVELFNGELQSETVERMLNGRNVAAIGNEVILFKTATLVATRIYELSGIIRGYRNTPISSHLSGEQFVLLDTNLVEYVALDSVDVFRQTRWKIVPTGLTVDDVSAETVVPQGLTMKPWNPVQVTGYRESHDLHINWVKRTRQPYRMFSPMRVPVDDLPEAYQVEIVGTKRIITTNTTEAVYTASQQIEDFGSIQSSVLVRVYQVSGSYGPGFYTEIGL